MFKIYLYFCQKFAVASSHLSIPFETFQSNLYFSHLINRKCFLNELWHEKHTRERASSNWNGYTSIEWAIELNLSISYVCVSFQDILLSVYVNEFESVIQNESNSTSNSRLDIWFNALNTEWILNVYQFNDLWTTNFLAVHSNFRIPWVASGSCVCVF